MIISRTPYRVSFFGGGTDYPSWYQEHGGAVLSTTIDKYCYLSARYMPAFFGNRYRVMWSKSETVNTIPEIQHSGVRGCLEFLGIGKPLEINHAGDLPARSGLGSSSAFTVGMLNVMHALEGDSITKAQLAMQAITVEQHVLKETVGVQDQIQCAHGGLNVVEIKRDGGYGLFPITLSSARMKELQAHLMLLFTGTQRNASEIAAAQMTNIHNHFDALKRISGMAHYGADLLACGYIKKFGELLHESWLIKRELSHLVSNPEIDAAYEEARKAGAIGGKLIGAGGGGFMLLLVPPEKQLDVEKKLGFTRAHFGFENSGSTIIYRSDA